MTRSAFVIAFFYPALLAAQGMQVAPRTGEELDGVLRQLATRHAEPVWCTADCVTFYEIRFSGQLGRGEIRFESSGAVTGEQQAYVELFGARPAVDLDEASLGGRRVPLFWSGRAYATALPPGDFRLSGTIRFNAGSAVSLSVPGPAGLVALEVSDADVVGTGERRGVRDATYQLTPRREEAEQGEERGERLRRQLVRSFQLARDKTFTVEVSARGARPGQVIPIALMAGEAVEDLDPAVATLRSDGPKRWIDWIAAGPTTTLSYGGKWTAGAINLEAPAGADKETWRVRCDDPYLCSFGGDAETLTGETGHVWAPLPGQKLEVTWRELDPLAGVHTVAQQVSLATKPVARNLHQRLQVDWKSSSGSLVSMTLPEGALVSRFELDDIAIPMLKDTSGALQIQLPAGRSQLEVDWELAGAASILVGPPVPSFSEPVGTLWHRIYPADGRSVLQAGGLAGSPRVAFWPTLGACLALALVVWWLTRWGKSPLSSTPLWLISVAGFAIVSPAAPIPLALALGLGRWLARIRSERAKPRILLELFVWAGLTLAAVVVVFATLQHALFAGDPMEVTSFVHGGEVAGASDWSSWRALTWGAYLAGDPEARSALPSPWALTVGVIWIRLLWAAWAVVIAVFLLREGRLGLAQLSAYWDTARWAKPQPETTAAK
jgi:hypothetical protein